MNTTNLLTDIATTQLSTVGATLPANVETLVGSFPVVGMNAIGFTFSNGGSHPLTNLRIAAASSPTGNSCTRLNGSNGDFGTASAYLYDASANPHQLAAGAVGTITLTPPGSQARIDVYATSTLGTILTIDACSTAQSNNL